MNLHRVITLTASLLALTAATPVLAQSNGITIDATGAFLTGRSAATEDLFFSDEGTATDDFTGGFGALGLGYGLPGGWDITGRYSRTFLDPASSSFGENDDVGDIFGSSSSDLDIQTLDIEIGYAPELDDNFDLRIFAGARGLHANSPFSLTAETVDKLGDTPVLDAEAESDFVGIGPRLGVDIATMFGDTPFGISGSVAGAVIFGETERTDTVSPGGGPALSEESTFSQTVVNLEASIGLDYHITDQATITAGYRAEHFSDILTTPDDTQGQLLHGPFLKAKISF